DGPAGWARPCKFSGERCLAPLPLLLARFDAACGTGAARAEPSAGTEVALPWHVVDLDADAIGILEEDRVVAGRELRSLFRWVNDAGAELVDHEAMDRIDIFAAARAQAQVVQPGRVLIETPAALLAGRAAHEDAGAAADAVDDVLALDQGLHGQEVTELLPERHALLRVCDGELDVGDTVDLDGHDGSFVADARGGPHHRSARRARQCGGGQRARARPRASRRTFRRGSCSLPRWRCRAIAGSVWLLAREVAPRVVVVHDERPDREARPERRVRAALGHSAPHRPGGAPGELRVVPADAATGVRGIVVVDGLRSP